MSVSRHTVGILRRLSYPPAGFWGRPDPGWTVLRGETRVSSHPLPLSTVWWNFITNRDLISNFSTAQIHEAVLQLALRTTFSTPRVHQQVVMMRVSSSKLGHTGGDFWGTSCEVCLCRVTALA